MLFDALIAWSARMFRSHRRIEETSEQSQALQQQLSAAREGNVKAAARVHRQLRADPVRRLVESMHDSSHKESSS